MKNIVVMDGARTAIGTFGGALANTSPIELGEIVVKEAIARSGIDGRQNENVVFDHVINTEPRGIFRGWCVGGDSGNECQSSLRLRSAGHCIVASAIDGR